MAEPLASTRIKCRNASGQNGIVFKCWWGAFTISTCQADNGQSCELECEWVFYDIEAYWNNQVVGRMSGVRGGNNLVLVRHGDNGPFELKWEDGTPAPLRDAHNLTEEEWRQLHSQVNNIMTAALRE